MKLHFFRMAVLHVLIWLSVPALQAQSNVVSDWNKIASDTIVAQGGKASVTSSVWFAYTSIAVYDAVNAIHGQFQPFYYHERAARSASDEAAAAAAAHRILVHYFPAQQPVLESQFDASLANISTSADAKAAGIATGEASAAALIAARTADGLEADVPYTPGSGVGAWQPTPPKFPPPLTPWLGQMRPFTMSSASQFLPEGPSPLASRQWEENYNQTRTLGKSDSSTRTAKQTEIGLFWTEHTGQQYARSFSYVAENQKLNVMDSARLMAILWTGFADAGIGCWNAKYKFGFWRPVTAIRAGGGNPALSADPNWEPLAATPSHPEYPAAHACVTSAISELMKDYFGTSKVHVVVDSHAFSDGIHTHTFEDTEDLHDEVLWARIYAGFHFHHSLLDGSRLGRQVADQVWKKHFRRRDE